MIVEEDIPAYLKKEKREERWVRIAMFRIENKMRGGGGNTG